MARIAIGGDKEKKNLMILGGLLVAIAVVVMVLYNPFGGGSGGDDTSPPTPSPTPGASAPEPSPDGGAGAASGGGAAPGTPTASGNITAASLVSLGDYRTDPFEQFVLPQPPPPPPPVPIPAPVEIMPPPSAGGGVGLPPMGIGNQRDNILVNLPPITPRRVVTAPTAPRALVSPDAQGGGSGSIFRAQNKRLSGVVIGDSVRALLEVKIGDKTTTRVVQPGDEVDGIRILRLERVVEAGQTVTRLVVRENNQEQYVELRPAPQQQQGGAEGLLPGGMPPM